MTVFRAEREIGDEVGFSGEEMDGRTYFVRM